MKVVCKLCTLVLAWALAGVLGTTTAKAAESLGYDQLVAQAEAGKVPVDYTVLRMAYVTSAHYDPYSARVRAPFEAMWKAFTSGDCTTALAKSDDLLKINYTYISAHAVRGECFNRAGDHVRAAIEDAVGRGLDESLMGSGVGTMAKPYVAISLNEEGYVLAAKGIAKETQSLVNNGGHMYDLIEGTDTKTGHKTGVLFQIDGIFAGETRSLEGKRSAPGH